MQMYANIVRQTVYIQDIDLYLYLFVVYSE